MTTDIRILSSREITTTHSNYGGREIVKNSEGLYFVTEPYRNHAGVLRYRRVGGFAEHKQVREFCQENHGRWMAITEM